MASFVGMDPEAIRRVADALQQSALQLGIIQDTIQRLMNEGISGWEGADAADFTYSWEGEHRASLQTAMAAMEKMALDVIEDIAEQEKASGIIPGGPGSVLPPGSVVPGTTTPTGAVTPEALAEMSDEERAEILAAMDPKDAAKLLAQMDPEDQAATLSAMSDESRLAALMAMSPAARAAALAGLSQSDRKAALDAMTPAQQEAMFDEWEQTNPEILAEDWGESIVVDQIQGVIEGSGEAGSWKIEGKAEAQYSINADGSVDMQVHLEGGLGRAMGSDAAGGSLTGGLQAEYGLHFESAEDAEEFLKDLGKSVTDIGVGDVTNLPDAVVDNVKEVFDSVEDQKVVMGGYVQGEIHGEAGDILKASASGRVDYKWDATENEHTFGFEVKGSVEGGDMANGPSASVAGSYKAELTLDGSDVKELKFTESGSASFNLNATGDRPGGGNLTGGLDTAGASETTIKVTPENSHYNEIMSAMKSGNVVEAHNLAEQYGEVVVRTTVQETIAEGGNDFSLSAPLVGKVAGVEYSYGITGQTATSVHVRPEDGIDFHNITEGIER